MPVQARGREATPAEGRGTMTRGGRTRAAVLASASLAILLVVSIAAVAIVLASGGPFASSGGGGGAVYLLDPRGKAYQALMRGEFEEAKSIVDEALKRSPSDRELELLRVRILIEWGRLAEAKSLLEPILKRAERQGALTAEALVLACTLYSRMSQPDIAIAYLIKATDARPDDAHLWKSLARLQFDQKRYSEALSSAHRSLQLDPKQEDLKRFSSEIAMAMTSENSIPAEGAESKAGRGWTPSPPAPEVPDPSRKVPRPEEYFPKPSRGPK